MASQIPWAEIQEQLREPKEPLSPVFDEWLNTSQENRKLWNELTVIYSVSGNTPEYFIPHTENAWSSIESRLTDNKHKVFRLTSWMRVAASILLVILGVAGSWLLRSSSISYTETYSPYGHKTMVLLPDSSEVWLNGNSRIRYRTDFTVNRDIELKGEAFFKVRKNKHQEFTVKLDRLDVKVFGTTFNVKAYPEDKQDEIALQEGSVGIFKSNQMIVRMDPGDVVTYSKADDRFFQSYGNIDPIISWNQDELIIENKSLEEIAKYLERWYGVNITLDPGLDHGMKLSFKVKTESLTELLSILSHMTPLAYDIQGKEVTIHR